MYRFKASCVLAAMLLALPVLAQQSPAGAQPSRDEQIRKMMQPSMNPSVNANAAMMVPAIEAIIEAELNLAAMPETAQRIASFKKNLFDALRKSGFTAEQAFQLTLATALPSASPSAK